MQVQIEGLAHCMADDAALEAFDEGTGTDEQVKALGAAAGNLSKDMTYRDFKGVMPDIVKRVGWVVSNLRKLPASIGKA